jgi:SsrA-binding protein
MKIFNKKATFEYEILERLEAGVNLTGAEVKSIKGGHAQLTGAFVRIIGSEAYLVNAQIFPYIYARPEGYDPKRTRKLLLHKAELIRLKSKLEGANLTLIPLSWYTKGPLVKLEVGLARGKKQYEKREVKRKEDQRRELERDYRGKVK